MDYKYFSNAPKSDLNNYKKYCEILNSKINDPDVYNIGIIAPYGAGKSSLIKTYESIERKKEKILKISLASFNVETNASINDTINKNDDSTCLDKEFFDKDEKAIELSILQQIIYSRGVSKFPNTRISRIDNSFLKKRIFNVVSTTGLITFGVLTFCFYKNYTKINYIILYIFFALTSIFLFCFLFNLFQSGSIRKVKLFDIEVESEKDNNLSVLNRFADELIYFFSASKIEVLVIEDLDRFENLNIFTKLREINQLINNSATVKQKVTFLYCIKDDMFKFDVDRAKFFEFVISLIPILNTQNSRDIINSFNGTLKEDMRLENDYINKIRFFVNDYRLLNNTFNDYKLYWSLLNSSQSKDLKNEKLFSMMLYKNKEPKDFALLQKRDGLVFNLFESKNEIIKEKINSIKSEIKTIEKEIEEIENNSFYTIDTLKKELKLYLIESNPYVSRYKPDNSVSVDELQTFENKNQKVYYYLNGYTSGKISDFETKEGKDYFKIERAIKDFNNNKIEQKRQKINDLKNKIILLSDSTLKQISDNYELKTVFKNNESELIKFLIVNGYIEEDYLNYLFIPSNMLSKNDECFISNVLLKNGNNVDIELKYIDNVISDLDIDVFKHTYCLNVDLFKYIFVNKNNHYREYPICLNLIKQQSDDIRNFIVKYVKKHGFDGFIIELFKLKNPNFKFLILKNEFTNDEKIQLFNIILNYKEEDLLLFYDENSILSNEISKCKPSLLNLSTNVEQLKRINVKFENLDDINKDDISLIIKNNLYVISKQNVEIILKELNLPILLSTAYEKLNDTHYVENNIDDFYRCLIDYIPNETNEDLICKIIDISNFTLQANLIEKNDNIKFSNIEKFTGDILNCIIKFKKYLVNWKNLNFLNSKHLIDDLTAVVNENFEYLSTIPIDDFNIKNDILKSNINLTILKSFINKFTLRETDFFDQNICELIKYDKIEIEDFKILNNYPLSLVSWYELNPDSFDVENIDYSDNILIEIIKSKIDKKLIETYINHVSNNIISSETIDNIVCIGIENNIRFNDKIYSEVLIKKRYDFNTFDLLMNKIQKHNILKDYSFIERLLDDINEIDEIESNDYIDFNIDSNKQQNTYELLKRLKKYKIVSYKTSNDRKRILNFKICEKGLI